MLALNKCFKFFEEFYAKNFKNIFLASAYITFLDHAKSKDCVLLDENKSPHLETSQVGLGIGS